MAQALLCLTLAVGARGFTPGLFAVDALDGQATHFRCEHIDLIGALTRSGRKPLRDRRQQSVMAIGHDQIDWVAPRLRRSSRASNLF